MDDIERIIMNQTFYDAVEGNPVIAKLYNVKGGKEYGKVCNGTGCRNHQQQMYSV